MNNEFLKGFLFAMSYINDVKLFLKQLGDHISGFKTVLERISEYSLKIKWSKVFLRKTTSSTQLYYRSMVN